MQLFFSLFFGLNFYMTNFRRKPLPEWWGFFFSFFSWVSFDFDVLFTWLDSMNALLAWTHLKSMWRDFKCSSCWDHLWACAMWSWQAQRSSQVRISQELHEKQKMHQILWLLSICLGELVHMVMVVVVVVVVLLVVSLGANGRASPPTLPIWVSTSLILDPIVIQPTYSVNFSSSSLVSARVHTRVFFLVENFQTMKAKKKFNKKKTWNILFVADAWIF